MRVNLSVIVQALQGGKQINLTWMQNQHTGEEFWPVFSATGT